MTIIITADMVLEDLGFVGKNLGQAQVYLCVVTFGMWVFTMNKHQRRQTAGTFTFRLRS